MTLSSEEKERRLSRCCKTCGKCMNSLAKKSKYCSIKCVGESKTGVERTDCRIEKQCQCGRKGWGKSFWNCVRQLCRECCKTTPNKVAASNEKNRRYKTCLKCGFVGYGPKNFPYPLNGCCVSCRRVATGRPLKIPVLDQWDEWANKKGNEFFREHRKRHKLLTDEWCGWAKNKQLSMITRKKRVSHSGMEQVEKHYTWDTCLAHRMYKLSQRMKYRASSEWDRKAKQWMQSLIYRRRQHRDSRFVT